MRQPLFLRVGSGVSGIARDPGGLDGPHSEIYSDCGRASMLGDVSDLEAFAGRSAAREGFDVWVNNVLATIFTARVRIKARMVDSSGWKGVER
jgi:hypothetical protein